MLPLVQIRGSADEVDRGAELLIAQPALMFSAALEPGTDRDAYQPDLRRCRLDAGRVMARAYLDVRRRMSMGWPAAHGKPGLLFDRHLACVSVTRQFGAGLR